MKYNGDYESLLSIEQYPGGYLIRDSRLGGTPSKIVQSFEELCDEIAFRFGIREVGERIVVSATKEKKEKYAQAIQGY